MGDKILIGDDRMKKRTRYEPNEIILHENYAEILLYNRQGKVTHSAFIDLEDVERVNKYTWGRSANQYVECRELNIYLHRFIMNCPKDMEVDHINHNGLDNRKENLRIVTHKQNKFNNPILSTNTSGVTGVSWSKQKNKWRAYITIDDKQKSLGYYFNKEDAIKARKEAEEKYFGEFRNKE